MADREKVIKAVQDGLDFFEDRAHGSRFEAWIQAQKDALALLKAQELRVMTLEEAKSAFVVEYRSGKMREVGSAMLDIDVDPLNAKYGKIYRVWTSRPTDEQRQAVKWE